MPDAMLKTAPAALPTKADTVAYLGEMLAEQRRIATSIGLPRLAYLIGVAALEAESEIEPPRARGKPREP